MAFEEAANLDELDLEEPLLVELAVPVCLVRLGEDDVRAVHNTCSHQRQPLHEGMVEDGTLVCAAHASRFDLGTGESVGIPEVPAIPVYACKVEDSVVLVDLDQPLNAAEPA